MNSKLHTKKSMQGVKISVLAVGASMALSTAAYADFINVVQTGPSINIHAAGATTSINPASHTGDMSKIWDTICSDKVANHPNFSAPGTPLDPQTKVTIPGIGATKTPKLNECCDRTNGKWAPKNPLPPKCLPPAAPADGTGGKKKLSASDSDSGLLEATEFNIMQTGF